MSRSNKDKSLQGVGVGLRGPHVPDILKTQPPCHWFELLTDNHLTKGGVFTFQADEIAKRYPIALHGVGMSLGSTDPIDWNYIKAVKELAERTEAVHISEHLSFTACEDVHSHELLPLPKTKEALHHTANRIREIQDYLSQQILIENVSTYLEFDEADYCDAEFINQLCELADCNLLLDVNNIYVNAVNHDHYADATLNAMPWHRVKEIHIAGHEEQADLLLDTHGGPVCDEVLELFKTAIKQVPDAPVLLEWDTKLPSWDVLWAEAQRIEAVRQEVIQQTKQRVIA